jgi:hypothetical protein
MTQYCPQQLSNQIAAESQYLELYCGVSPATTPAAENRRARGSNKDISGIGNGHRYKNYCRYYCYADSETQFRVDYGSGFICLWEDVADMAACLLCHGELKVATP